jgi:SAM-dependent methyltransferase
MTSTTIFDEIKAKQRKMWSSGDYAKVAWLTVPVAEDLIAAVGPRPDARVLDVATGTGHVALAAARRFCHVTGVDYVPGLLATARRRAAAEGLEVEFREADAEDLPFPDASFDYVLSSIGVMFTADHQRAADELVRVCKRGGRIGIASWTPAGFVGQLLKVVGKHAAPPPAAVPPTQWGTEATVRELLGHQVTDLTFVQRSLTPAFPTAEFFADFQLANYGPTKAAADRLQPHGRAVFRDDLVALARHANRATDGSFASKWDYLVAQATKA